MENKWIKVEDKMPKENIKVLLHDGGNIVVVGFMIIKNTEIYFINPWDNNIIYDYRYWVPLPQPPTE